MNTTRPGDGENERTVLPRGTEYDPGPYGAVRGSLLTGFEIYGPFSTVEQAADWAEERSVVLGPMTIMPIRPPKSCGVTVNKP